MKKRIIMLLLSVLCMFVVACGNKDSITVTEMQSGNNAEDTDDGSKEDDVEQKEDAQDKETVEDDSSDEETTEDDDSKEDTTADTPTSSMKTGATKYQGLEVSATSSSVDCVTLKFSNNSDRGYSIGWVGGGMVTLVTTEGQFYYTIGSSLKITPGSSCTETCYFDNATGEIVSISISEVHKLSSSGLPENAGTQAATITIEF